MSAHIPGIHAFPIIDRMLSARRSEGLTSDGTGAPLRSPVHGFVKRVVAAPFAGLPALTTSAAALRVTRGVAAALVADETPEKAQRG